MAGTAAGSQDTSQGASAAGSSTAASSSPNATVVSIDVIPRASGGGATGAGSVAGAAVGGSASTGTTGSSMAADRVYRITLRMDDGSTRVVTQETTPDFRAGDRVNIAGGGIAH
jgi:outer membrane lipoprotein SlyB